MKKYQAINNIEEDSFAPPSVTYITTQNQPKKIDALEPVVKINSSGAGIPYFTNYGTDQGLA